ncbi:hypothetical protein HMPREF1544_10853 [Mucor circinelloides 1006PhL]|uniref:Uncharacterized protein n=1 Tax=Mucor circinelloides f. circinelloides (strain 1006PhL) TaxID=1220926 RepID=S2JRK3_MUCC1|nr:hypothetical protein HMPREF1544_10853 [Mucor circinelloides 1006PhL]
MHHPQQNFSIPLKDECPYPDLYQGERPYSIIIEASQFGLSTVDSNLLDLLRKQYPQGISINHRMMKKYNNRSKSKSRNRRRQKMQNFIEIGFASENKRAQALEAPFIIDGETIQVSKTLDKNAGKVYRLNIYDIDKLNDPSKYYNHVLNHLNKYGTVLELHLHYSAAGGWFEGEGCALWIDKEEELDEDFGFYKHPKLDFSVEDYKVNE